MITLNGQSTDQSQDDRGLVRCPLPEILDSHDMSDIFGVSRMTLKKWRERGLPYIKIGIKYYFIESSVLAWLKTVETRET